MPCRQDNYLYVCPDNNTICTFIRLVCSVNNNSSVCVCVCVCVFTYSIRMPCQQNELFVRLFDTYVLSTRGIICACIRYVCPVNKMSICACIRYVRPVNKRNYLCVYSIRMPCQQNELFVRVFDTYALSTKWIICACIRYYALSKGFHSDSL